MQGASDSGLIPMLYPDYQRVDNPEAQAALRDAVGHATLDDKPGLTVVEIMNAAEAGQIRGMYIMGENPAMSDPDVDHAREALATLDHLVVQDIFLTETAYLADVVLPATAWPEKIGTFTNTDRMVQLGRKAIEPPGEARQDLWIINELAQRSSAWTGDYGDGEPATRGVQRDAPRHAIIAGITWERLEREAQRDLSLREGRRPGRPGGVHRELPDRRPGGRSSCRPTSSRPTSGRTPSTRWCSSPAASSSTGTPAA